MLSFELLSIQTNKQAYATNDARFVNNTWKSIAITETGTQQNYPQ